MGYDAKLGGRIRSILGPRKGLSEKEMFGGLAFLRDGKMFVGIIKDELMARVGKEAHEEWESKKGARTMDFTHRPMKGYLQVRPEGFAGASHPRSARATRHKRPSSHRSSDEGVPPRSE